MTFKEKLQNIKNVANKFDMEEVWVQIYGQNGYLVKLEDEYSTIIEYTVSNLTYECLNDDDKYEYNTAIKFENCIKEIFEILKEE